MRGGPALAKIGSFPTLSSTSSTPAAICPGSFESFLREKIFLEPARVEEAGEAGRGERPVVLRDPETAGLSTLRSVWDKFKEAPKFSYLRRTSRKKF